MNTIDRLKQNYMWEATIFSVMYTASFGFKKS